MEVRERIAYIRGLLEGADGLQADSKTQVIWQNILDVCDSLAESVSELQSEQEDLEEYVYGIDTDLCDLEDEIYGFAGDQADGNGSPGGSEGVEGGEDPDEDPGDDDYVRAECPRRGEETYFEEAFLYDDDVEISCPECGEILYRSHDVIVDENGEYLDGEAASRPSEGDDRSP